MAHPIVWIVVIGYIFIGLFLNGFLNAVENEAFSPIIILLWPIGIALLLIFGAIELPFWMGRKLGEILEKRKNRGDK